MKQFKFGYIKIAKEKLLTVYMRRYTIYFNYKGQRMYILWSTERKGFTDCYMKEMRNKFFPKSYVEKTNPIVASGSIVKGNFKLKEIMFPYPLQGVKSAKKNI